MLVYTLRVVSHNAFCVVGAQLVSVKTNIGGWTLVTAKGWTGVTGAAGITGGWTLVTAAGCTGVTAAAGTTGCTGVTVASEVAAWTVTDVPSACTSSGGCTGLS